MNLLLGEPPERPFPEPANQLMTAVAPAHTNRFILKSVLRGLKSASLLILVITAFVCSRALFFLFHDPEGPNLLIVTGLAVLLYRASVIASRSIRATSNRKKLLFAICTQLLIVTGLYTIA